MQTIQKSIASLGVKHRPPGPGGRRIDISDHRVCPEGHVQVVVGLGAHVFEGHIDDDKKVRKAVVPIIGLHLDFDPHRVGVATDGNGRPRNQEVRIGEGAPKILVGDGLWAVIGVVSKGGYFGHATLVIGEFKSAAAWRVSLRGIVCRGAHANGATTIDASNPNPGFKQMLGTRPSGVFTGWIPCAVFVSAKGIAKSANITYV